MKYRVIGLMSGTSLDGLDIAYVEFQKERKRWNYEMPYAQTVDYEEEWRIALKKASCLEAQAFQELDIKLGEWMGEQVKEFIAAHCLEVDFVASHGHTVFHQPHRQLTVQIGHGASLAAKVCLPVVSDFRRLDVALGGQGAPLVPLGDELLFADYHCCLNLGGIANLSTNRNGRRIAFDVCPCNIVLNHVAEILGKAYDEDGNLAQRGTLIPTLLDQLNQLDYYQQGFPKSLGREWIDRYVFPTIFPYYDNAADVLHTFTEHIAFQIAKSIRSLLSDSHASVLITGGGAFNQYLVSRIDFYLPEKKIVVPDELTIKYKEALIFALLGVLRWRNEINVFSSV
ncbi:MAG: anhydro-N-acetylmuramic acid kinase, partial [Flammeovirgaceae bacterium]|nr:anhydro-N-acetylmuramic acid kinase [Flammeovirgaceae bacterium]MDW8287565.1 anhydro-N-acetylmuramic acid kinase [Flammeovirgaceae bacterium]